MGNDDGNWLDTDVSIFIKLSLLDNTVLAMTLQRKLVNTMNMVVNLALRHRINRSVNAASTSNSENKSDTTW
jgi:hypothetical protein